MRWEIMSWTSQSYWLFCSHFIYCLLMRLGSNMPVYLCWIIFFSISMHEHAPTSKENWDTNSFCPRASSSWCLVWEFRFLIKIWASSNRPTDMGPSLYYVSKRTGWVGLENGHFCCVQYCIYAENVSGWATKRPKIYWRNIRMVPIRHP